jgi:hypothetical protein
MSVETVVVILVLGATEVRRASLEMDRADFLGKLQDRKSIPLPESLVGAVADFARFETEGGVVLYIVSLGVKESLGMPKGCKLFLTS